MDSRKILRILEESLVRFSDHEGTGEKPPRFLTGNRFLDPYVAELSNNLGSALAQVLIASHYDLSKNLYNESFSLAMWLVGLGYKNPKSVLGGKRPQSMVPYFQEVAEEIQSGKVDGMALFGDVLKEYDMVAPPNPLLLRKLSFET